MDRMYIFQHLFLVISLLLSIGAFRHRPLLERCMLLIGNLNKGRQFDRLFLSGFVHADYAHLAFNMITYYCFAYPWNDIYVTHFNAPRYLFVAFYLSAIVVVNLFIWLINRHKDNYASLGASGGVSAVVFSCILLFPWEKLYVFLIPIPAIVFALLYLAYSTYQSIKPSLKNRINHLAHLVGSIYGILFSLCIEPNIISLFWQRLLDW